MRKGQITTALFSLLFWLVLTLVFWPPSPLSLDYVRIILVAAPLLIVPFCVPDARLLDMSGSLSSEGLSGCSPKQTGSSRSPACFGEQPDRGGEGGGKGLSARSYPVFWLDAQIKARQIMALGGLFGLGMLLPTSWYTTLLVLPWWVFSVWLCWYRIRERTDWSLPQVLWLAQPFFLFTAACWALADRLQLQPLGFTGDIVLLTAVHFHYAGFALTWLVSKVEVPDWACWGIVAGVGLVAIGITSSQLALPTWIEVLSVSILAVSALRLASSLLMTGTGWSRLAFALAAVSLSLGMLLALAYGWRYYFPISALNIPVMYALHGSLNSLGFALPATWAYLLTNVAD